MSDELYSIKESDIDTVLGEDVIFEGDIHMESPIIVKGKVRGTIHSTTEVYISKGALVNANVTASHVSVHGTLEGNIRAEERIELFKSAKLNSEIETADLVIQSGSQFNGSCTMMQAKETLDRIED